MQDIHVRKRFLIALIAVTTLAPVCFVRFDEPTAALQITKHLAKIGSLCGTVLIVWQFLLGFRQVVGKALRDLLWVFNVHKSIGRYALLLIALHPVFITIYYITRKGFNPLTLGGGWPFWAFVLLGQVAFLLMALIVVTSVFFRERLSRTSWYGFHLTAYLALPLVLAHSLPIGMTLEQTALSWAWWGLIALGAAFYIFRALCVFGLFSEKHVVSKVEDVGPNVVKITARPLARPMEPHLGQFIYFRLGRWGPTRPFTVSHYDRETGEISITVKALGRVTTRLQSIEEGQEVFIDGPYGIFAHAALESERPIVMIAGGIGITPFTRLFQELAYEPGLELHLFYGNRSSHEIVYKEELEDVERVDVIHVLSDDPHYPGESGFITTDLLEKYLEEALESYEFLICGPPVMIRKLEAALEEADVPPDQVHHELFEY